MKKINLVQFRVRTRNDIGWNAAIGFWHEIVFEMYKRDQITLDEAYDRMKELLQVRGV